MNTLIRLTPADDMQPDEIWVNPLHIISATKALSEHLTTTVVMANDDRFEVNEDPAAISAKALSATR